MHFSSSLKVQVWRSRSPQWRRKRANKKVFFLAYQYECASPHRWTLSPDDVKDEPFKSKVGGGKMAYGQTLDHILTFHLSDHQHTVVTRIESQLTELPSGMLTYPGYIWKNKLCTFLCRMSVDHHCLIYSWVATLHEVCFGYLLGLMSHPFD